ncbi:hypothetical protein BDB01DRAFT_899446 [Pilobolus umbonatus]|nr:hypothetical protein BDB01DRAFT_899446 [Pilobolus umbonatus]
MYIGLKKDMLCTVEKYKDVYANNYWFDVKEYKENVEGGFASEVFPRVEWSHKWKLILKCLDKWEVRHVLIKPVLTLIHAYFAPFEYELEIIKTMIQPVSCG